MNKRRKKLLKFYNTMICDKFAKFSKAFASYNVSQSCYLAFLVTGMILITTHVTLIFTTSSCFSCANDTGEQVDQRSDGKSVSCGFWFKAAIEVTWMVVVALALCSLLLEIVIELFKRKRLFRMLNLNSKIIRQVKISREEFLKSHPIREDFKFDLNQLSFDTSALANCLHHPNLLLVPIPESQFYVTGEDFMFGASKVFRNLDMEIYFPQPHLEAISVVMRDVLQAVMYLHERKIYHLNVQLKNVLVLNTTGKSGGYAAKIGDFTFAKMCEYKEISTEKLGLEETKRPPECFAEESLGYVDGEKFDCWCIGIMAYELFTGGMLSVEFSLHPNRKNLPDLNRARKVMDMGYFVSAMDSRWNLKAYLLNVEPHASKFWDFRCREFYDFGKNYFDFARGLLKFHPELRSTAKAASETKLMKAIDERLEKVDDTPLV